jgi:hypothetical protein
LGPTLYVAERQERKRLGSYSPSLPKQLQAFFDLDNMTFYIYLREYCVFPFILPFFYVGKIFSLFLGKHKWDFSMRCSTDFLSHCPFPQHHRFSLAGDPQPPIGV